MSYLEKSNNIDNLILRDARKEVYIIDSSVILKWFCTEDEGDTETAEIIYKRALAMDCHLISPELLIFELLNIFKHRTDFSESKLEEIVKDIFDIFVFTRIDYKTFVDAYSIARKIEDSIYDCIYIAMSEKYKVPLVTADKKLYEKAKSYGYDVILLSDFVKMY
ncbi:MAG: type II toxin-antitoxin system VapC family toxin [Actinobacteria bacterium]|nr:type II toxin-antitoxin system VapC family toxin [Actinomycetota bacterium]